MASKGVTDDGDSRRSELDPFGSIGLAAAAELAIEGASAADQCVRLMEQARRRRRGAFKGALRAAHLGAESAGHISVAAEILAEAVADADWLAVTSEDGIAPMAALVCSAGMFGRYLAEVTGLVVVEWSDRLRADTEISPEADSWLLDLASLVQLLTRSGHKSERTIETVAQSLQVTDTVAAATASYRCLATSLAASEDLEARTLAMQTATAEGMARGDELARLAAERSNLALHVLAAPEALDLAHPACVAAAKEMERIEFEFDVFATACCMIAKCALETSQSHIGALIGLLLLSSKTGRPKELELEEIRHNAIVSCAIASIFLASSLRQIAESFEIAPASLLVDRFEEAWHERYDVARILTII